MYAKKIQIINYGPINQLDITFPFEGNMPKPVLLVGENGSGKSILLSHLVNGLISAKGVVYSETPEVDTDKVYKIRSDSYIRTGKDFYYARVAFEDDLFIEEIRLRLLKEEYNGIPEELSEKDAQDAWNSIDSKQHDYIKSSFYPENKDKIENILSKNCILYFPPNRFEEPAWLNEKNLRAKAKYMNLERFGNYTIRKIINYSPLHDNQNWFFDLIYDTVVFNAKGISIHEIMLRILRSVIRGDANINFKIGSRLNRVVSIQTDQEILVPNIFQLSSGEFSLLNLFLSILRDFDLSSAEFAKAKDVRGIVIIDEIDLHLHAVHQYKVLPELINMFPNIQFIVTTHSPLLILGMKNLFGEDGFALYRLPQGQQIGTEEFSEFKDVYEVFRETNSFSDDMQRAIKNAQKPQVFVDGKTDQDYLLKAFELLGEETKKILDRIEIKPIGGNGNFKNAWRAAKNLPQDLVSTKVVLLYDCEDEIPSEEQGNFFRRRIPKKTDHPIQKGIENLFSKKTLEKAREFNSAFIDIKDKHKETIGGREQIIPEKWEINQDEKTNLCNWLCDSGTSEDFEHFQQIVDILQEILD